MVSCPTISRPTLPFSAVVLFILLLLQSSPRKENEVSQGSSGAFQVYRRPVVASNSLPNAVEKKPTKGLSSVIEDHRRRGEVLRKQQQLLAKQLLDIQVRHST